ncbi:MAG TPA: Maf family protein [bacterium]|nr:Maf family protein [bacterium]
MRKLLLASASPRRSELLSRIGLSFEVMKVDYSEVESAPEPGRDPAGYALMLAEAKFAEATEAAGAGDDVIICADTIVEAGGKIFGKPADREDARRMLRELSGVVHRVHTGVCVGDGNSKESFVETTEVEFRELADGLIDAYIESGEPFDKAGAYGIQGLAGAFVKKISGCFPNVVGLPVSSLAFLLRDRFGYKIEDIWRLDKCHS